MTSDRKLLVLLGMVTVFAIAIVAAIALSVSGDDGTDAEPAPEFDIITETVTETVYIEAEPIAEEPTGPATTVDGDGRYEVGRDMRSGTYRSTDNFQCYWEITTDANGDNILSNDNTDGAAIMTVRKGQFFGSQNCSEWVRDQ